METIEGLAGFERRGPGSESERRAAGWLAGQLTAGGRDARIEPFWCRPNWALAHAWHVVLGLAGSLVSVGSPRVGGALILVALLSLITDEVTGYSLGRRLSPERASQNVIATPRAQPAQTHTVRLILTANYDAGRIGVVNRRGPRAISAAVRNATGGFAPGWLAWMSLMLIWLLVVAVLRLEGSHGSAVGVAQLFPTVALVLALAALIDVATADFSPAAGDNASGVAAALAIARALDAAPPRNVYPELVLQGAGEAGGVGLRRHLRARRKRLRAANTIVLGLAPCGGGQLRYWFSDGQFVPLRYLARLRQMCEQISADPSSPQAARYRGRGATPALPARAARLPAIAIGCTDRSGLIPHSHERTDTPDAVDPQAAETTVAFALILIDAIDAYVGRTRRAQPAPTPG
jgi:hypothetical protein